MIGTLCKSWVTFLDDLVIGHFGDGRDRSNTQPTFLCYPYPLKVLKVVDTFSICIFSIGTPNSSETTIAMTVLVPVPMSLAPILRLTLPSEKSLTITVEGGPPPSANQRQLAIPTPRCLAYPEVFPIFSLAS